MKTKYLWVVVMLVTMVQPAVCQTLDSITREQIRKDMEEMKAMQEKERREVVEELRKTGIKELSSLSFSTSGSRINSGVYYELTSDDGQYAVKIKLDGEPYEEAKTYSISNEQVKELIDLFNEYEVWRWNGFNEHHPDVMDGSSFYFSLNVQDDKKIEARGYMMYPQNYGEVIQEMIRIIDEGKGEVIDEGEAVPVLTNIEEIKYLRFSLYECTDNYSFHDKSLYELTCDGDEYSVKIQHEDETYEEAKKYPVSEEQVKELIDLFNKFEVWKWDGFSETDYNATIEVDFALTVQDNKTIQAGGYGIYPENFGKVIQEMIRILTRDIEEEAAIEWNDILEEDEEDGEVSEEEGDNGILVPVIIGAGVLVIVLLVIGVVRRRR